LETVLAEPCHFLRPQPSPQCSAGEPLCPLALHPNRTSDRKRDVTHENHYAEELGEEAGIKYD